MKMDAVTTAAVAAMAVVDVNDSEADMMTRVC